MDASALERFCLSLPGAGLAVQWGGARVFKVGGKMFAILRPADPARVCFKCSDLSYDVLTEQPGIVPAPYLARAKWVQLEALEILSRQDLEAYLRQAYELVFARLPRAERARIAGER
jgi:predicted DNA-binding protein (MmcQ/YjbR family)